MFDLKILDIDDLELSLPDPFGPVDGRLIADLLFPYVKGATREEFEERVNDVLRAIVDQDQVRGIRRPSYS